MKTVSNETMDKLASNLSEFSSKKDQVHKLLEHITDAKTIEQGWEITRLPQSVMVPLWQLQDFEQQLNDLNDALQQVNTFITTHQA